MTDKINSFKDLIVWKKSIDHVTEIYKITNKFPDSEIFSLTNQIRRASVSVPANIAEGWGRRKTKVFIQFLNISHGSLCELETLFIIARNLEYTSDKVFNECFTKIDEIGKMLTSLITKLELKVK